MPLEDFSFCFRKGDVGGERGLEAALAFRTCAEAESELEGDSRKKKMNINNTTPITTVTGLRRNDRVGPMAVLYCVVLSVSSIDGFLPYNAHVLPLSF